MVASDSSIQFLTMDKYAVCRRKYDSSEGNFETNSVQRTTLLRLNNANFLSLSHKVITKARPNNAQNARYN